MPSASRLREASVNSLGKKFGSPRAQLAVHFVIHNVQQSIKNNQVFKESKTKIVVSINRGKHPPMGHPDPAGLETKPELTQTAELLEKDIKAIIILLLRTFKKLNGSIKKINN